VRFFTDGRSQADAGFTSFDAPAQRLRVRGVGGALGLPPPTAKASKIRALKPATGGLGVLGVKIDRYESRGIFSGILEGESFGLEARPAGLAASDLCSGTVWLCALFQFMPGLLGLPDPTMATRGGGGVTRYPSGDVPYLAHWPASRWAATDRCWSRNQRRVVIEMVSIRCCRLGQRRVYVARRDRGDAVVSSAFVATPFPSVFRTAGVSYRISSVTI
jgi:hypothetical protein